MIYNDGVSEITPLPQNIHDGTFELFVTPVPPVALFVITPPPPNYVGDPELFDATSSTPGWNGYANVPIVNYNWDFGDGNVTNTATPITSHTYTLAGTYTITLIVTDADGRVSAPYPLTKTDITRPSGCVLDVFTQKWRYIDPIYLDPVQQGKGPGLPAELFRPGDLVQLYATTIYNGDPVQGQLVAYEVHDNNGFLVLAGVARSDANGLAEYDFRIPWPCPPAGRKPVRHLDSVCNMGNRKQQRLTTVR